MQRSVTSLITLLSTQYKNTPPPVPTDQPIHRYPHPAGNPLRAQRPISPQSFTCTHCFQFVRDVSIMGFASTSIATVSNFHSELPCVTESKTSTRFLIDRERSSVERSCEICLLFFVTVSERKFSEWFLKKKFVHWKRIIFESF